MNIYIVPMLIAGILCALLSTITWLFRRRESINRMFSFFTLTLAVDSFAFFAWFQFGSVEQINTWMRFIFAAGFLVPIGIVLFFVAFTGYDQRLEAKVLGIKVKHFQTYTLLFICACMLLAQFTDLIITIPEDPRDIWDTDSGSIGKLMFPIFAGIFLYLLTMAFKSYKATEDIPQRRFILLLAVGTIAWLLFGYIGALFFPSTSDVWLFISYTGTSVMAVFYFVAILNYQLDKVHALNSSLERKVEERTRELQQNNAELEDALDQLKQMQRRVIVQEKMATLGQLVAGISHELNSPVGAIRSMHNTLIRAVDKLKKSLGEECGEKRAIQSSFHIIAEANQVMNNATERVMRIVQSLRNFARLDEAEFQLANLHDGIESALTLLHSQLGDGITVVKHYGDIEPTLCSPGQLNQVFMHFLQNAVRRMDDKGEIRIETFQQDEEIHVQIRDSGSRIPPQQLEHLFDVGFSETESRVGMDFGLSTDYHIIREHQGEIEVENRVGEGVAVTIRLPIQKKIHE